MGLSHEEYVIKYRDFLRGEYGDKKALYIRLDNEHYPNERLEAVAWNDDDYVLTYTRRTDSVVEQRDRPIECWCCHYDQVQGIGVCVSGEDFVKIGSNLNYPANKVKAIADSFCLDINDYSDSVKNNHSSASNNRRDFVY
jgi:hypothetical protein